MNKMGIMVLSARLTSYVFAARNLCVITLLKMLRVMMNPKIILLLAYAFLLFSPAVVSAGSILDDYNNSKVRMVIVPGHDDDLASGGTQFRGLTEARLNLQLSEELVKLFGADERFEVFITRDVNGPKEPFASYFKDSRDAIIAFRNASIVFARELIKTGRVRNVASSANSSGNEASIKLYGANKWINENGVRLALHVHFNDYAGRTLSRIGKYSGFMIFVPEGQLTNHHVSAPVGRSVWSQLKKHFPTSDNPTELGGPIEEQKLIAVGGSSTLNSDVAAILIEYGYIYESAWINSDTRPMIIKELAYQTYVGVKKSLEPAWNEALGETSTKPFVWNSEMKRNPKGNQQILALQIALTKDGLYPPAGFSRNDCPISGIFGPCTRKGVLAFQARYKLARSGYVDAAMLKKINQLYGSSLAELSEASH